MSNILLYLINLFNHGAEARTVGGEKSAISAYHPLINGHKVGNHPLIMDLMKSIRKNRPMKSRYHVIWDVSVVIAFLKSLDNDTISVRLLGWNTASLLAIAAAKRGCELAELTIDGCVGEDKAVFYFEKAGKTQKHKVADPLCYPAYTLDESICPVAAIQAYKRRTAYRRDPVLNLNRVQDSKFFIATIRPYNSVGIPTIANWIKHVLARSGVDISKLKKPFRSECIHLKSLCTRSFT